MPEIVDHVAYLSQEIGPRPAGTEEEQQAALYITEHMQKEAGLSASIEDFSSAAGNEAARTICAAATIAVTVLAMFLPVLAIPAIIVTAVSAALAAAEVFGRPVLSSLFVRGVSQNVVAKYEPGYSPEAGGSRRRKVIVVARYDSGKVRAELNSPVLGILPILNWVTFGALVLVPVLLLVRYVFFLHAVGAVAIVFNVLTVIALVAAAIPAVLTILHKVAAYNEAANCNAAGVAVLMDVAARVGRGRVSAEELAAQEGAAPSVHGEAAARAAGLVPEGAQLVYEASSLEPPDLAPQSPAERLAAAKAAVAALTGQPVSTHVSADIAGHLVQVKEPPLPAPTDENLQEMRGETREAFSSVPAATIEAAQAAASFPAAESVAAAPAAVPEPAAPAEPAAAPAVAAAPAPWPTPAPADDGVPDWFKKAQEKAKRPAKDNAPVQRSRYADALDAAVNESSGYFEEANRTASTALDPQLARLQDGIREVPAPSASEDAAAGQPAAQAPSAEPVPAAEAGEAAAAVPPAVQAAPDVSSPFLQAMPSAQDLQDIPTAGAVKLPSFLDPQKTQEMAAVDQQPRSENRVTVAVPPLGSEVAADALPGMPAEPAAAPEPAAVPERKPIVLPDIGQAAGLSSVEELPKQRAPLAEAASSPKAAAKSLLSMLPSIGGAASKKNAEEAAPSRPAPSRKDLRATLPSLSGAISRPESPTAEPSAADRTVALGAAGTAGMTGAFAPVGDELLQNVDADDLYVDDADDSAYDDENFTESGAFAGPGYVEMPKSRVQRLFGRFRRKHEEEQEPTPHEWLDVDEQFDARTVGKERGGWESFRPDDAEGREAPADGQADGAYGEYDAYDEYDDSSYGDGIDGQGFDDGDGFPSADGRRWNGGAFSRQRSQRREVPAEDAAAGPDEDAVPVQGADAPGPDAVADEIQQIYQFRHPDINTEVWFVALGSELAGQAGMKAFLAEHAQDLRGSIIIELDGLGAGDLSLITREGAYRKTTASSRMKRYLKKATQATGTEVGQAEILWANSASSYATSHGFQAMHLAGMAGAKQALYSQGDDVLENVDADLLVENADFVMELLKNI